MWIIFEIGRFKGSFRFDCLLRCTTETGFYNMVFNAHSENELFFPEFFFNKK